MLYVVDVSNHVIDVDAEWEAAATARGGAGATRNRVIGRPLDGFMAGDVTKMFMRAALDAARLLGQERVLPYRCDTPEERRQFEMVISPLGDGRVQVAHRLLSAEPRKAPVAPPKARVMAGWRCSQCLSVRQTGSEEWRDADAAGDLPLAADVCPACTMRLFDPARPDLEQPPCPN